MEWIISALVTILGFWGMIAFAIGAGNLDMPYEGLDTFGKACRITLYIEFFLVIFGIFMLFTGIVHAVIFD